MRGSYYRECVEGLLAIDKGWRYSLPDDELALVFTWLQSSCLIAGDEVSLGCPVHQRVLEYVTAFNLSPFLFYSRQARHSFEARSTRSAQLLPSSSSCLACSKRLPYAGVEASSIGIQVAYVYILQTSKNPTNRLNPKLCKA